MMGYDEISLWALVVLLCLISLTTGRELFRFIKNGFRHAIEVWKWQPFVGFISGDVKKRKHHNASESEMGMHYNQGNKKHIFPRSRRIT